MGKDPWGEDVPVFKAAAAAAATTSFQAVGEEDEDDDWVCACLLESAELCAGEGDG